MGKRKPTEEEGVSLLELASEGLDNIRSLSKSSLMSEKLIGLSALLFAIILGFNFTNWLVAPEDVKTITTPIIFIIGFMFGLFISIGYSKILMAIVEFAKDKVQTLRLGIGALFLGIPFAIIGVIFSSTILAYISLSFIGIQLLLTFLGFFLSFSEVKTEDVKVKPFAIWKTIGRIGSICSILGLILTIALPFVFSSAIEYQCINGEIKDKIEDCPDIETYISSIIEEKGYIKSSELVITDNANSSNFLQK